MIRQGAGLCEGAEDVLRALEGLRLIREPQGDLFGRPPSNHPDPDDTAADALRERVASLLSQTPTPRDEIVRILGEPASVVLAALVELSLAGRAELMPGGLVCKG